MQRLEGGFSRHMLHGAVLAIAFLVDKSDVFAQEPDPIAISSFELSVGSVDPNAFDTSIEANIIDVPAPDAADTSIPEQADEKFEDQAEKQNPDVPDRRINDQAETPSDQNRENKPSDTPNPQDQDKSTDTAENEEQPQQEEPTGTAGNEEEPQQEMPTDTAENEGQPQPEQPSDDDVVSEIPPSEIPPEEIPTETPPTGLEEALTGFSEEQREATFQNLAQLGQTFTTAGLVASAVNQDIIAAALDGDLEPDSGGQSPFVVTTAGAPISLFMVSGYKRRSHDGFSIESSLDYADGEGPGFDEDNYGLTIGTRFDGSTVFGTAPGVVTLGLIGNYTHTDIEVDAPAEFADLNDGGSADVDSWSVGGFGLVTDGKKYGILTVTGTFGSPETSSAVIPSAAEFDTYGIAASALDGTLIPVSTTTKFDLRGGVNLVHAESEDYQDSLGTAFTDGELNEVSGTLSARLFTVVQTSDYVVRPFVQGGVTHRFHYENELTIDGEEFSFDDADTTVFARAGVDFNIDSSTQAYLAVRGDASEDVEAIAAQIGVTFKTN